MPLGLLEEICSMKNEKLIMKNRENGFSSIQTMLILFILSLSVLGLGTGISLTQKYYYKNEKIQQEIILLREEVAAIKIGRASCRERV